MHDTLHTKDGSSPEIHTQSIYSSLLLQLTICWPPHQLISNETSARPSQGKVRENEPFPCHYRKWCYTQQPVSKVHQLHLMQTRAVPRPVPRCLLSFFFALLKGPATLNFYSLSPDHSVWSQFYRSFKAAYNRSTSSTVVIKWLLLSRVQEQVQRHD